MDKMLILRGIRGNYPDPATGKSHDWPTGAIDEPSARKYAALRGYEADVLAVSGETGLGSRQTIAAVAEFRRDPSITALYGFSGGGYNVRWILQTLSAAEKKRIRLVVVLGAPLNSRTLYQGAWELEYRLDPKEGHMAGPRMLLESLSPATAK